MSGELWLASAGVFGGLVLMVFGGEVLVRGASRLAAAARISPLVIGLTVVAFGTSAPELAVSLQAALAGEAEIAVGNVVGSNIFNVLFILGMSAVIVPLAVSSQLIRRDVPLLIVVSFVVWWMCLDHQVSRWEGACLSLGIVVYTSWCVIASRSESAAVQAEFQREQPPPASSASAVVWQCVLLVAGLMLLALGSRFLVAGAVAIATHWGVSQLLIGLTIVSIGTSLPEVVTSLVAAWRGERDIAVGNVIGSNLFNLMCVLGFSGALSPVGTPVADAAIRFDIPVMLATTIACFPIFFSGQVISRWEGCLLLFYYGAYTALLILNANQDPRAQPLGQLLVYVALPLTVLALSATTFRSWKHNAMARRMPA